MLLLWLNLLLLLISVIGICSSSSSVISNSIVFITCLYINVSIHISLRLLLLTSLIISSSSSAAYITTLNISLSICFSLVTAGLLGAIASVNCVGIGGGLGVVTSSTTSDGIVSCSISGSSCSSSCCGRCIRFLHFQSAVNIMIYLINKNKFKI